MNVTMRWEVRPAPDDKSGVATFIVAGKSLSVTLGSFSDAHAISALLDAARDAGRNSAHSALKSLLFGALESARIAR